MSTEKRKIIPLDEGECAALVEMTNGSHDGTFVPLVFGASGCALDLSRGPEVTGWMLVVLADWRGVEVSAEYRALHPLPARAAEQHVVPDPTSNRAGAS